MKLTLHLILPPKEAADEKTLKHVVCRKLKLSPEEINAIVPTRRSIDARSKESKVNLSVDVFTKEDFPLPVFTPRKLQNVSASLPVIIIGCGPAGLFAALRLIENGFKPVIIERGKNVRDRRRDLAVLNKEHKVNPDSNYCFGEGGAGTYSDGKLYTRSDKRGDVKKILNTFIEFGASENIGVDSHPHIGTNKLPGIITGMTEKIIECGGEIHFNHLFHGFQLENNKVKGARVSGVKTRDNIYTIQSESIILATGHSARDVFEYFHKENFLIESKSFSLGVRVEHPQELIDKIMYHCEVRSEYLPPAPYTLSTQANGRGVYSFCMCPGGIIAAAATAPGEVVVNGWSPSKRNNPFANSGMVVSVDDNDFKPFQSDGPLRALRLQQSVERKSFLAGGSNLAAPAQRLNDFINNKSSSTLPDCSYIPGVTPLLLDDILGPEVTNALKEGLKEFGKKLRGFDTNEAILVAPESRTSSPVRIPRDKETLMHPQIEGLFPCGEGAGYAGGIMSAAMDGERCADAVTVYYS